MRNPSHSYIWELSSIHHFCATTVFTHCQCNINTVMTGQHTLSCPVDHTVEWAQSWPDRWVPVLLILVLHLLNCCRLWFWDAELSTASYLSFHSRRCCLCGILYLPSPSVSPSLRTHQEWQVCYVMCYVMSCARLYKTVHQDIYSGTETDWTPESQVIISC